MCSWERTVDDWAGNDPTKKAISRDLAKRFKSVSTLVNHERGLVPVFRDDKRARVFHDGRKSVPAVASLCGAWSSQCPTLFRSATTESCMGR